MATAGDHAIRSCTIALYYRPITTKLKGEAACSIAYMELAQVGGPGHEAGSLPGGL